MEYHEAFPELAGIYLEDSWVLEVAPSTTGMSFRLEVVLTPEHPRYRPPAAGEKHCYLAGWLTVRSREPIDADLSGAAPATDATGTGTSDFGNIDRFVVGPGETWEMEGSWGQVQVVRPEVSLLFE